MSQAQLLPSTPVPVSLPPLTYKGTPVVTIVFPVDNLCSFIYA